MNTFIIFAVSAFFLFLFFGGIRIVRPTERGIVETLGKYSRFGNPGFNWIIPVIQRFVSINVTERMADIRPQEIITEDNLNAKVDLVVYYKVKADEESVKQSIYAVDDFVDQIVVLAQTTARNVIGGMLFKEVNSKRNELNAKLAEILSRETQSWGVEVVRVELKEIIPPQDVQDTMNRVIKAENEKRSAIDFATAKETEADGSRRAAIKESEGKKQALILEAEGQAQAFNMINASFVGNAQLLKQLDVIQNSLQRNAKIILSDKGMSPQIILGEIPLKQTETGEQMKKN